MGGAGIRIGYVIGSEELIERLGKWRLMYEVNQVGIKYAVYILDHMDEVKEYAENTKNERELLLKLISEAGYDFVSSHGNWIHFHCKENNRKAIETLKNSKVLFKSNTHVPFDNRSDWIRLTVGPGLSEAPYMKKIIKGDFE